MKQEFVEERLTPTQHTAQAIDQIELDISRNIEEWYVTALANAKSPDEVERAEESYWALRAKVFGVVRPS